MYVYNAAKFEDKEDESYICEVIDELIKDGDGDDNDDEDYEPMDDDEESESDVDWNASEDQQSTACISANVKLVAKISQILEAYSEPNCTNALVLNRVMSHQLLEMRGKLEVLLRRIKERYKQNEKRLESSMKRSEGFGIRGAYLKGGTFYLKGNMFFKDRCCRNCPNNIDYERRSSKGELFPMDLELRGRHIWTLYDKAKLLDAIKEQVTDHIAYSSGKYRPYKQNDIQKQISLRTHTLVDLLAEVGDDFQFDWQQISVCNLRYRHAAITCEAMWRSYLHPTLKHSAWTDEENRRLLDAVRAHQCQDWDAIARAVGQRSDYQCFVHYRTQVFYMQPKRWLKWNKADDKRLVEVIEQCTANGVINWNMVMTQFPNKPKTTVQSRYAERLNPQISHEPFTAEEDLVLLSAVKEYGERFSFFPRTLFPHRSLTQLRSRYTNTLKQRDKLDPWSLEDDKKLMTFVGDHGSSAWMNCSKTLGNHTRTSCRTRYITITNFFAKNPGATYEDLPRKKVRCVDNIITPTNWLDKVWELRENPSADFRQPKKKRQRRSRRKDQNAVTNSKRGRIPQRKQNVPVPPKSARAVSHDSSLETDTELGQQAEVAAVTIKQPHSKPTYINKLRANELRMYHFFKYAYDYRPEAEICTTIPGIGSLTLVAHALHFNLPTNGVFLIDNIISSPVRRKCKLWLQSMKRSKNKAICSDYQLPPSWSTVIGFRALCVQSAQVQMPAAADQVHQDVQTHVAVQQFRARLRSLFFRTILLSRLNPAGTGNLEFLDQVPTSIDSAIPQTPNATEATEEIDAMASTSAVIKCEEEPYLVTAQHSAHTQMNRVVVLTNEQRLLALHQLAQIDADKRKRKRAELDASEPYHSLVTEHLPEHKLCIKSEIES